MRRLILFVAGITLLMAGLVLALPPTGSPVGPKPGDVIAGQDFGFQVTSTEESHLRGFFVVRVNGHWTQAEEVQVPRVIPARP